MELDKVCRLCGRVPTPVVSLLSPDKTKLRAWLDKNLNVEFCHDNDYPRVLCTDCLEKIGSWMMFKGKCQKTQRYFKSIIPLKPQTRGNNAPKLCSMPATNLPPYTVPITVNVYKENAALLVKEPFPDIVANKDVKSCENNCSIKKMEDATAVQTLKTIDDVSLDKISTHSLRNFGINNSKKSSPSDHHFKVATNIFREHKSQSLSNSLCVSLLQLTEEQASCNSKLTTEPSDINPDLERQLSSMEEFMLKSNTPQATNCTINQEKISLKNTKTATKNILRLSKEVSINISPELPTLKTLKRKFSSKKYYESTDSETEPTHPGKQSETEDYLGSSKQQSKNFKTRKYTKSNNDLWLLPSVEDNDALRNEDEPQSFLPEKDFSFEIQEETCINLSTGRLSPTSCHIFCPKLEEIGETTEGSDEAKENSTDPENSRKGSSQAIQSHSVGTEEFVDEFHVEEKSIVKPSKIPMLKEIGSMKTACDKYATEVKLVKKPKKNEEKKMCATGSSKGGNVNIDLVNTENVDGILIEKSDLMALTGEAKIIDSTSEEVIPMQEILFEMRPPTTNVIINHSESKLQKNSYSPSTKLEPSNEDFAKANKAKNIENRCASSSGQKFSCNFCQEKFRSKRLIEAHTMLHMKGSQEYVLVYEEIQEKAKSQEFPKLILESSCVFKCIDCIQSFELNKTFEQHFKEAHSNESPFVCGNCPNRFRTKKGFERHIKMHIDTNPAGMISRDDNAISSHCQLGCKAPVELTKHASLIHKDINEKN